MSKTDHARPARRSRARVVPFAESFGRRQPRPPRRRTGTRVGVIRIALKEG